MSSINRQHTKESFEEKEQHALSESQLQAQLQQAFKDSDRLKSDLLLAHEAYEMKSAEQVRHRNKYKFVNLHNPDASVDQFTLQTLNAIVVHNDCF